jgi:5-hydroxyisourate hydrolase-like protein (transthyretin family)
MLVQGPPQEPVDARSVSGRVVDARFGAPVAGAEVELLRCTAAGCSTLVGSTLSRDDGTFRFAAGVNVTGPLSAGQYVVAVQASDFQPAQTPQFQLSAGQDLDVGAISLSSCGASRPASSSGRRSRMPRGSSSSKGTTWHPGPTGCGRRPTST